MLPSRRMVLVLLAVCGACPQGPQVVARRTDAKSPAVDAPDEAGRNEAGSNEAGSNEAGSNGGGDCPWTVVKPPRGGPGLGSTVRALDYRVAFDPQHGELAALYKSRVDAALTRVSLRRFTRSGLPLGSAVELQAELAPPRDGATWHTTLLGLVATRGGWVALWSQMAYLHDTDGYYTIIRSSILAQRVQDGVALAEPQTLVTTQTYLVARALHWTGEQLTIATLEGPDEGPQPALGGGAGLRLRRFDAELTAQGAALTVEAAGDSASSEVLDVTLSGDAGRMGLFASTWAGAYGQTDGIFALIEGDRVVSVESTALWPSHVRARVFLAYANGRFLRCSDPPGLCELLDARDAAPIGSPIHFFIPDLAAPAAVRWLGDRFWVAAVAQERPARRILGWVSADGAWGHQAIEVAPALTVSFLVPLSNHLFSGSADELLWVDYMGLVIAGNGNEDELGHALLQLTRQCP